MAFGKKKKKAKHEQPQQTVKKVKVDMSHNPLYPPKKESDLQELLTAFGTTAVSLFLVGVIVANFSYASRASSANRNRYNNQQSVVQKQEDGYDGNADDAGVNGGNADDAGVNEGNADDAGINGGNVNDVNINGGETYAEDVQDDQAGENAGNSEGFEAAQGSEMDGDAYEEPEADRAYIIDDSDSRYLYVEDLEELSAEELFYARNEIYARCGRLFSDEGLQSYFDAKEWYHGTIPPEEFTEDMLNDYERVNTVFIRDYEVEKGYQ